MAHTYYVAGIPFSDELFHHGVRGQKWGIRRYQNPDGTLTAAGKERYSKALDEAYKSYNDMYSGEPKTNLGDPISYKISKDIERRIDDTIKKNRESHKIDDLLSKSDEALNNRNKQSMLSELFNTKKFREANSRYKEAFKKVNAEYDKVVKDTMLETYDAVRNMPVKERKEAMAYVYTALGLDW